MYSILIYIYSVSSNIYSVNLDCADAYVQKIVRSNYSC